MERVSEFVATYTSKAHVSNLSWGVWVLTKQSSGLKITGTDRLLSYSWSTILMTSWWSNSCQCYYISWKFWQFFDCPVLLLNISQPVDRIPCGLNLLTRLDSRDWWNFEFFWMLANKQYWFSKLNKVIFSAIHLSGLQSPGSNNDELKNLNNVYCGMKG